MNISSSSAIRIRVTPANESAITISPRDIRADRKCPGFCKIAIDFAVVSPGAGLPTSTIPDSNVPLSPYAR